MEEQPSVEQTITSPKHRFVGFLKRLAMVLGAALVFVLIYCLVQGQLNGAGLSNGFFIASFVLLAIATWPILGEAGRSITLSSRVSGGRENYQEVMETERRKRAQGASTTYLFGFAGILALLLALLSLGI